ncbi:hypothetical protein GCM10022237_34550 [Nocardioides ginsengisoli]|uniref:DUF892 family protein n=1 Tax=Nocardioides ginsengisoli TaxID=363868 RepID=A0ABW3VWR0_9ACTN
MDDDVLRGYLQHHWTASTLGMELFRRVAGTHGDPVTATAVREMSREITAERETLRALIRRVGGTPSLVGALTGRVAERVGRLKPNGRLLRRSPLTDVLELEALRDAVYGKRAGWELLRELANDDPRLDAGLLDDLIDRAGEQLVRLKGLHLAVARKRILT